MKHPLILPLLALTLACLTANAQQLDFGDHSSAIITSKAWGALNAQNYSDAIGYAKKCVEMYEKQAVEMQKGLKVPVTGDKESVAKLWALNEAASSSQSAVRESQARPRLRSTPLASARLSGQRGAHGYGGWPSRDFRSTTAKNRCLRHPLHSSVALLRCTG